VIITTHARPHLVCQAVSSALTQSLQDIEVIVVLDGPDPATLAALELFNDVRLRVHVRDVCGGQAKAINSGIQMATGKWTALLDDDDEWLAEKLEVQLRIAESSDSTRPVVSCYFLAREESGDTLWPLRAPRSNEPIGNYLFCRSHLAFGEGILPTSMLFAPTELFRLVPLAEDLPKHCDLDWLIRVDQKPDVMLEMPVEQVPLAIWHQQGHDRLSRVHDWRFSYQWITRCRQMVTPAAYAGFLLTWVSFSARSQGDFSAFPFLLKKAFRNGRPGVIELVTYAAVWSLPLKVRARWSSSISMFRKSVRPE
jgi:glycosyltransferase involved in cell wall biosynthesis